MNRRTSVVMALLIVVVLAGALAIGLSGNGPATKGCKLNVKPHAYYTTIQNGKVMHPTSTGRLCDTLTISNKDDLAREIAFGPHDAHVPYDGVAERVLGKGQSFTITLNQIGTFRWHDHLHDTVQGYFTVSK